MWLAWLTRLDTATAMQNLTAVFDSSGLHRHYESFISRRTRRKSVLKVVLTNIFNPLRRFCFHQLIRFRR